MKKHLLRFLTVLLMACLSVGVLAACGGNGDEGGEGSGSETTYTLTYDVNGGNGTAPQGGSYKEGEKIGLALGAGLTKTDYTFAGWLDGTTVYAAGAEYTMPARNVTLKANWEEAQQPPVDETSLQGVWTGTSTELKVEFEVAINLVEDNADYIGLAVAGQKATVSGSESATPTTYMGMTVTEVDGKTILGAGTFDAELKLQDGKLTMTLKGRDEQPITVELATHTALPASTPVADGTYYQYSEEGAYIETVIVAQSGKQVTYGEDGYTLEYIGKFAAFMEEGAPMGYVIVTEGSNYTIAAFDDLEELSTTAPVTLTFAAGDHAAEGAIVAEPAKVKPGSTVTLPGEPDAEDGYEFTGWKIGDDTNLKQHGDEVSVSADVTATAQWTETSTPPTPATYTVTYELGDHAATDATVPTAATATEDNNYTVTLPAAPAAAEGWQFAGWKVGDDTDLKQPQTEITVSADVTVTAQWTETSTPTPTTYTVTYELGDHAATDATVPTAATATEANQYKVTLPAAPEAAQGYEFAGWQVGAEVKNAETEITVSENITVTATWNRAYTTDNDVQAQILKWFTAGTLTKTVENGTKVTVEATISGNIADVFFGLLMDVNMNDAWYRLRMDTAAFTVSGNSWRDPYDTKLDSWSATYTSGSIDSYKGMSGAIIVAEAALNNNVLTYTVSVYATTDTEHANAIVVTQHTVTSTTDVTELALNFYYDHADGSAISVTAAKITYPTPITEPVPTTYTVTYELGDHAATDATVPTEATATEANQYKVTLPAAPAAAEGWQFAGWQVGAEVKEAGAEITVSENITVTATWREKTYTVTFEIGDHGTTSSTTTFTGKKAEESVELPTVVAEKGFKLTGWKVGEKDVTDSYTVAAEDAEGGTITLVAQYDYIEYTVHFVVTKPEGAEAEVQGTYDDVTITNETMISRKVTFPKVTLEGYVLTGWKLGEEATLRTGASYAVTPAQLPENTEASELTFTAVWGKPDYAGIWTDSITDGLQVNGDKFDVEVEITVQLDEANGADVVWKESYTDNDREDHVTYYFGHFTKEADGSYKLEGEGVTFTLKINGQNGFEISRTSTDGSSLSGTMEEVDDLDFGHEALPAKAPTEPAAGDYYVSVFSVYTDIKYHFEADGTDTVITEKGNDAKPFTYKTVGNYLVISGTDIPTHAIYVGSLSRYFTTLVADGQLTTQAPSLQVDEADITFELDPMDVVSDDMPTIEGTHRVGESFNLPDTTPTDKSGSRTFLWWETKSGEHIAPGAQYTVKAEDADPIVEGGGFSSPGTITGYKIVFTAAWTKEYTVQYLSFADNSDGSELKVDASVVCGTDETKYHTNEPINIIEEEPTKEGYTFIGWKLYIYSDYTYSPVRSVANIIYRHGTEHSSYTPNNTEDNISNSIKLVFAAQWEAEKPAPLADISGTWTNEDTTIIIDGDKALVIAGGTNYSYYTLTADGDHYNATGKNCGGGDSMPELTATFTPTDGGFTYKPSGSAITFTSRQEVAHIELEGVYKTADGSMEIDFTQNKLSLNMGELMPVEGATFTNVGGYIVIEGDVPDMGTLFVIVYMSDEKVMAWTSQSGADEITKSTPVPETYTVVFSFGDESHATSELPAQQENKSVGDEIELSDPTAAAGYKFDGWYVKEIKVEGTYTVKAEDAAEGTITITAHWSPITYTVKLSAGDHGSYTEDKTVEATYGQPLTIDDEPTANAGYTFTGWKKGDAEFESGTEWTFDEEDVTLTAQYEAITYTLKLEKGDIPAEPTMPQDGLTVSLDSANFTQAPTLQYYTFLGWTWTIGSIKQEEPATTFTFTAEMAEQLAASREITLTANWVVIIGADNNQSGAPGTNGNGGTGVQWIGKISKGNHYKYSGDLSTPADGVYKTILTYIWSGETRHGFFRIDRYIASDEWDGNGQGYADSEGWAFTKVNANDFGGKGEPLFKAAMGGTFAIDVDWTDESIIVLLMELTAKDGKQAGYFQTYYTIVAANAETPLKDEYSIGFACEASQAKIKSLTSDKTAIELPKPASSQETSNVTVGAENCQFNYTNTNPAWFGKSFKQGETVTITGKVKAGTNETGAHGFFVPIAYLMSGPMNQTIFRLDGWYGGDPIWEGFNVASQPALETADSNYNSGGPGNSDTDFLNAITAGDMDITITYKWEEATKITITTQFKKESVERTSVFTITARGSRFGADEYYIGLGGENIYFQISSIVYPEA